jgi:hypothetical protein
MKNPKLKGHFNLRILVRVLTPLPSKGYRVSIDIINRGINPDLDLT